MPGSDSAPSTNAHARGISGLAALEDSKDVNEVVYYILICKL